MLKTARRISGDQVELGINLGIDYAEVEQIKRSHPQFVEATRNILMVIIDKIMYTIRTRFRDILMCLMLTAQQPTLHFAHSSFL